MKIGGDVHIPKNKCLQCDYTLDACAVVDAEETVYPKDGDITLCINCGYVMAFGKNGSLREMTGEEMHRVAGDKRMIAVGEAIAKMHAKRKASGHL
jgi:uncharacterized Fe-S center protein